MNGGIEEGARLEIQCKVNYTGNWRPVMKANRSDGQTLWNGGGYSEIANKLTIYFATLLTSADNGVTITLMTILEQKYNYQPRANDMCATNIPPYEHLRIFKANVLCKYEFHAYRCSLDGFLMIKLIFIGIL